MRKKTWKLGLGAAIVGGFAALAACSDDDKAVNNAFDAGTDTAPAVDTGANLADAATLTDEQIAGIALLANQREVAEANVALGGATAPAVREFATKMVKDFSDAVSRQQALFAQLAITTVGSDRSERIEAESDIANSELEAQTGDAFDKSYMARQVEVLGRIQGIIDTELLPAVQKAELRSELTTMRASIASHLAEAQTVQLALSVDAGTDSGAP